MTGTRYRWLRFFKVGGIHATLLAYSALVLFPILLVFMNSFKDQMAIFGEPLKPPTPATFSVDGYKTLFEIANFQHYFLNSLIVTVISLLLIVFLGAMAGWALAEYTFKLNTFMAIYLALGIMVPIRLGTVGILRLMADWNLVNTLAALIFVYTAMGLPLSVFILSRFFAQLPPDFKDAARIDGASEYRIFTLVLPLVRPALGTVAAISMIPVWNDLWFPLILAPSEETKTIVLGAQVFLGQFLNDWQAVLAALSLAMIPAVLLYMLFSKQLIRGLTAGAVK
ncbi:carbohydrate ABC transporter permease [Oceanithermus profundus]|uniref:Carbohydrate ABC transporter membrane protein 2, CUT1 family n=1 Tax=Oceanithermus profundus (strain DSM 14977 / NBRC 100410 / VKM B-2274 / 506) TaxID=670487 RepID=E4U790_OCEP5|nr:carbohydrate ABC transporter permease [Oceanithermus profundus]ADR36219.1 carbohydrate ABC transporter membrane protein 2, CUT1 family [Oceanithermus profundus DSM 14977]